MKLGDYVEYYRSFTVGKVTSLDGDALLVTFPNKSGCHHLAGHVAAKVIKNKKKIRLYELERENYELREKLRKVNALRGVLKDFLEDTYEA